MSRLFHLHAAHDLIYRAGSPFFIRAAGDAGCPLKVQVRHGYSVKILFVQLMRIIKGEHGKRKDTGNGQ